MDRGFISEGLEVKLGCSCFTRDCGVGDTCNFIVEAFFMDILYVRV